MRHVLSEGRARRAGIDPSITRSESDMIRPERLLEGVCHMTIFLLQNLPNRLPFASSLLDGE